MLRQRTRYIDGEPWNINDSHYPYELVRDGEIMSPADVPQGTNQALADLGYPQHRAVDEVYIRMATPDETYRLALPPGTPVAVHLCTGYSDGDRPVRHTVNVLPGDRHVVLFERWSPEDRWTSQ